MKRLISPFIAFIILLAFASFAYLYIDTHDIDVLNPKGEIGAKERDLIATVAGLMLIVVIPVFLLTVGFAWRYRASNTKAKYLPEWSRNPWAESVWWGIPFIIIVILATITWKTSYELNPFKPIDHKKKPLVIQVVALDWKWLFIYPEQGIATVNFVQFPEQTPINFEITADAPMNSFWIPQLGGQIYAMPNMRSKLHLIADEPGTFRGLSSNISGKGFAGMAFEAKATSQEDFDKWVQSTKQSSEEMTHQRYENLVEPSEYNPVALYRLTETDLFDRIVMKYSTPPKK